MTNDMSHPYAEFEHTPAWVVLEKAIRELEENHDLKLTTLNEYLVGYICKQFAENGLLNPTSLISNQK